LSYLQLKLTAVYAEIKDHLRKQNNLLYFDEVLFTGVLKSEEDGYLLEKHYCNGIPHGIHKTYYSTGQLREASIFTNGLKNGRNIVYFECGAKKLNTNYSAGELDGICEEWDNNGRQMSRKTYYKGKLIAVNPKF